MLNLSSLNRKFFFKNEFKIIGLFFLLHTIKKFYLSQSCNVIEELFKVLDISLEISKDGCPLSDKSLNSINYS